MSLQVRPCMVKRTPPSILSFENGMSSARDTMRFSQRTNWNTEESDLARAHRQRVQAGLPTADLTASNPTRCGFRYDEELLSALADPQALDYDPQPRGLLRAREAV